MEKKQAVGSLQTKFEKSVIEVVKYLAENWAMHKKFRHKGELIRDIGLKQNNWNSYEKGLKNIPLGYHFGIKKILTEKYNVNPQFLNTNSGSMFLVPLNIEEDEPKYYTSNSIKFMETEIFRLKKEVHRLEKLTELQEDLISALKKGLILDNKTNSSHSKKTLC